MDPDPTDKPFSDPDGNSTLLPNLINKQLRYWAPVLWIGDILDRIGSGDPYHSLTYGSESDYGSCFSVSG
jgi:hypothetical protein